MLRTNANFMNTIFLFILAISLFLAGCAPLLIAGGAVGGYAVAKDMEDGKLIDSK